MKPDTIFIKISGESISKGTFLPWVSNVVNSAKLRGEHRLVFEVAESDVITRIKETENFISGLGKPVCEFAIDHYGTTDQSIKIVKELPVDYVKIHGAMVNQISQDEKIRERVKNLIETAESEGAKVIIGSLEDPKTLSILWEWGIRRFQGYFIKAPHESLDYDFDSITLDYGS